MSTNDAYLEVARAYADGVRVLFARPGVEAGTRRGRGPVSYSDLGDQAEKLLPISGQLTREASARLDAPEAAVRTQTEAALLAKALTDLEISTALLEAAQDQEAESLWSGGEAQNRRAGGGQTAEPYLKILLGEELEGSAPGREVEKPTSLAAARSDLLGRCDDTLADILARVTSTGKTALGGLVGLGAAELASAIGVVGMDIAKAIGQAEKVTQLYELFRGYLLKACESIAALLGPQILKSVGEQVSQWVGKVQEGEPIRNLLEKLYETGETRVGLEARIAKSDADLDRFVAALDEVHGLGEAFRQKTSLVDKILPKVKWLTLVPATVLPQARLLLAATYVVLSGYVVLAGADYVDAPRLKRLGRVPGVRLVVEAHLTLGGG
jgi:hypothetical protein